VASRYFIAVLAVCVACGSFAAAPDAVTAGDAGAPDGATGAANGDGGGTDAAGDAGVLPGVRRCEGNVLISDDFDRGQPGSDVWTPAGSSAVVVSRDVGAPAPGLHVEVPPFTSGTQFASTIRGNIDIPSGGTACIEFDLQLEQSGPFTNDSYGELLEIAPGSGSLLFIEMKSSGLSLSGNGGFFALTKLTYGTWHHLTLRLPFGSGPPKLSLDDDAQVVQLPEPLGSTTSFGLDLGLDLDAKGGTTGGLRITYDNFRVTTR
jgi:hypothetical protein